jgi:polar amino acid transport system substrate-binding protein
MLSVILWMVFSAMLSSSVAQAQSNQVGAPQFINRELIVATKPIAPFVTVRGDQLEGFSIDLWDEIAKRNQWKFRYSNVETVKNVIEEVRTERADVGIAGISMTDEREQLVDFSYPMFNSGLQILVPERATSNWFDGLRSAVTSDFSRILLLMLGVIVVAGHVIWFIERRIDETYPRDYLRGVGEGIWRAGLNLATGGFGDRTPSTVVGRIVALVWVFLGIILISNFTAAVTTNLTMQQIEGSIRTPNDLFGKRVLSVANTTASQYLETKKIKFKAVAKVEDAYPILESGQADALVYDAPVLLHYANTDGRGRSRVTGAIFKPEFYGIALGSGSVLRESVNSKLLEMINSGKYQQLYDRWFSSSSAK